MKRLTIPEFHSALNAQDVSSKADLAFVCPVCGTVQSGRDLIRAGAGSTFEEVERYLGFSCVGRWTDAGPWKKGKTAAGCDWTLGGLFRLHTLEVVDDEGKPHPRFELATPDKAQAHERGAEQPEVTS